MIAKCEKRKVYNGVFCVIFFSFSLFAFHSISHQCRHSHEKSKDFVVNFFAALIKHDICMKYEKCIASVLYFVVIFVKTFVRYLRNAKYEKCITSLRSSVWNLYWDARIEEIEKERKHHEERETTAILMTRCNLGKLSRFEFMHRVTFKFFPVDSK